MVGEVKEQISQKGESDMSLRACTAVEMLNISSKWLMFVAIYGSQAFGLGQRHKFAVENFKVLVKRLRFEMHPYQTRAPSVPLGFIVSSRFELVMRRSNNS